MEASISDTYFRFLSLDSWAAARFRNTRSRALASLSMGSAVEGLFRLLDAVAEVELEAALPLEVGAAKEAITGDSSLRTMGLIDGE